jgi:hypothetical protein
LKPLTQDIAVKGIPHLYFFPILIVPFSNINPYDFMKPAKGGQHKEYLYRLRKG